MDFETDVLIEQIVRKEPQETFGLIICALFHQPKPIRFADFYHKLIQELYNNFTDDEKQSIYLYPLAYLHITITTLYNFKHPWPESPEKCLQYWKECFKNLKQTSKNKSICLTLDTIQLSKAAGFFYYKDEHHAMENLRQTIQNICIPENGQPALHIPNIVHTSFLRFVKKLNDPVQFEKKFHRICKEIFEQTGEIRLEIEEICLAFESQPYMHIDCDESHVLDIMKC
ncbi:hypothetical protein I4U23_029424 [Adineta vaga]|nr:hypothetical protein I4U23_029424 [Adineta vaga]